jgi:hypothetical protein
MTEPNPWRRVRLALLAVAFVLAAGTIGFSFILHLSVLDAFYDTTTVVTTIGFRQPRELTTGAKIFSVVLILAGVSTVLYAFGVVLEAILEGHPCSGTRPTTPSWSGPASVAAEPWWRPSTATPTTSTSP